MTSTKRVYGFSLIGGLTETPSPGYEPVRLALINGNLCAVSVATSEVLMQAIGHDDGWFFRKQRLAERWQRVGGQLLAKGAQ
jgi:hypothetical protein